MNNSPPIIFNRERWQQYMGHIYHHKKHDFFIYDDAANIINERLFDITMDDAHLWVLSLYDVAQCNMPSYITSFTQHQPFKNGLYPFFDEEQQHHTSCYDIISSIMCLHRTNDMVGALIQYRHALNKGGLFHSIMVGDDSLSLWRQALIQADNQLYGGVYSRVMPYIDIKTMGGLMQRAGFKSPIIDKVSRTITYNEPAKFLHDMQYMGAKSFLATPSGAPFSKKLFAQAIKNMVDTHGTLTINIDYLLLHGWNDA